MKEIKSEMNIDCPDDRCPLCWSHGIDSLKQEDGFYCEACEGEIN